VLQDMQRPLYMRPLDAIEYGVIDRLVPPQKASMMIDKVRYAYIQFSAPVHMDNALGQATCSGLVCLTTLLA
jgi:hypothetical protein